MTFQIPYAGIIQIRSMGLFSAIKQLTAPLTTLKLNKTC